MGCGNSSAASTSEGGPAEASKDVTEDPLADDEKRRTCYGSHSCCVSSCWASEQAHHEPRPHALSLRCGRSSSHLQTLTKPHTCP
ncbi:overexpressed in colon carcinoma 1 protein [Nerophis ophidion]|uniref:overexpressed in colon carcinoma 1 protein n=1 Tax=Nerophis ophidion TaxID=159077 RepID=UPI002ADFB0FF|nr:overexpressed in colon carcinoma 1 protein [Nerophis ophidion]